MKSYLTKIKGDPIQMWSKPYIEAINKKYSFLDSFYTTKNEKEECANKLFENIGYKIIHSSDKRTYIRYSNGLYDICVSDISGICKKYSYGKKCGEPFTFEEFKATAKLIKELSI